MNLPFSPPILPMLAKRIDSLPDGNDWIFEPKWDGFRALVFRDGNEILLQSRDERPLNRYFPELVSALRAELPERCVLDGEVVIERDGVLDFEALQLRLHPAASRVALLADKTPASMVLFDVLALDGRDLRPAPFRDRRAILESALGGVDGSIHVTPATRDRTIAADWFQRFEGAGLDGVIAKDLGGHYEPNRRSMLKIKHERDCDCVVAGFRWQTVGTSLATAPDASPLVRSLLLGLYDDTGVLQHVGVCASFSAETQRQLPALLEPYRANAWTNHPWRHWADEGAASSDMRMPGGQSRWSRDRDLSWEPLRPDLVAEVEYDHMQGTRFRHVAHFRRWRYDKAASDCTFAQLDVVPPGEITTIFGKD